MCGTDRRWHLVGCQSSLHFHLTTQATNAAVRESRKRRLGKHNLFNSEAHLVIACEGGGVTAEAKKPPIGAVVELASGGL